MTSNNEEGSNGSVIIEGGNVILSGGKDWNGNTLPTADLRNLAMSPTTKFDPSKSMEKSIEKEKEKEKEKPKDVVTTPSTPAKDKIDEKKVDGKGGKETKMVYDDNELSPVSCHNMLMVSTLLMYCKRTGRETCPIT